MQMVLDVTVLAYEDLRKKGIVRFGWEEDHFTLNLENCIRPHAYKRGMFVISQSKTYTSEIQSGEVSAKKAKILDLRLWGCWENYHEVHFTWECKRVADVREDESYKNLISEYIKEGIFRFVDEEYATGLEDAGMLAYVLAGDIPTIVHEINKSMHNHQRKRRLSASDHLELAAPISTFAYAYQSCHKRVNNISNIQLYHLFFSFDFNQ